jgi:hypothetical protein
MRLFHNCPGPSDVTSFYRGMGPLSVLPSDVVQLYTQENIDWTHVAQADVVFMQRPFNGPQLQLAKLAKQMRKPLWLDYDDNLFALTSDNPAYPVYAHPDAQASIKELLSLADVVSASTEELARVLRPLTKKVVVVENAFNDFLLPPRPTPIARKKLVVWRGGTSHQRDLLSFSEAIMELYNRHTDWCWVFMGSVPWFLMDKMSDERCRVHTGQQVFDYFGTLPQTGAALQIVPLADTVFNKAKSNIAWQEAAYAGSAALCPDWDEWHVPGAMNYKDTFDFFDKASEAMSRPEYLPSLAEAAWYGIERHYRLSHINGKRLAILAELMGEGEST